MSHDCYRPGHSFCKYPRCWPCPCQNHCLDFLPAAVEGFIFIYCAIARKGSSYLHSCAFLQLFLEQTAGSTFLLMSLGIKHVVSFCAAFSDKMFLSLQALVDKWDQNLTLFSHTLEESMNCQRTWLYLEPIFNSLEIQR